MKRKIGKMKLEEPYGAIVATGEGIEVEAKAQGFFAGYANTWDGIRKDAHKLAKSVRKPRSLPPAKTEEEEEDDSYLRLVEED